MVCYRPIISEWLEAGFTLTSSPTGSGSGSGHNVHGEYLQVVKYQRESGLVANQSLLFAAEASFIKQ